MDAPDAVKSFVVRVARTSAGSIRGTVEQVRTGRKELIRTVEEIGRVIEYLSGLYGPLPNRNLTVVETEAGTPNGYSAPGILFLSPRAIGGEVSQKLLVEEAEKRLYEAVKNLSRKVDGDVDSFLRNVVKLIPSINTFFDKVLVMADDQAVRENRLGLLQKIAALSSGVADLSRLEGF